MAKKVLILGVLVIMSLGLFTGFTNSEGNFYGLQEAYENGWLTQEDLLSIAYYYNGRTDDENFVPKPKTPESLDAKIENEIKKTHLADRVRKDYPRAKINGVDIVEYYGTYNDCVVIFVNDTYRTIDVLEISEQIVGGVTFENITVPGIEIWRK